MDKEVLPETVEAVVAAVDGEYRCARVRLGHPPIPFQDYDFGPDLVVDLRPLVQHLLYMVLEKQQHPLILEQYPTKR